ncbi:membrane protein implicated in regulation of membrane protease activity [Pseudonocardia eucalypti]|uniref:hypothetical protein n=1 Tax=Pseudonocardia eucalypti TaxID=648755 RepID=UPI001615C904|nr:membrane protein implicated in regulation of membrane protease activity [Pseudonocardia eucalypti]
MSWLNQYVLDRGLIGLVSGALGILAFGGTLSVVFGSTAIRAAAIVIVLFANLGLMAYLLASTGESRKTLQRAERLLARYCEVINERLGQSWRIKTYSSYTDIDANGDCRQTVKVSLVVESEHLEFFRIRIGPGWQQSSRIQRRVKADVSSLLVDKAGGVRWDVTKAWLTDGRLEILAHCPMSALKGAEIAFQIDLDWPAKCSRLVRDREPDTFLLSFSRPIEEFTITVVLPRGVKAFYELINLKESEDCNFGSEDLQDGRQQVKVSVANATPMRKQGFKLDIRKGR